MGSFRVPLEVGGLNSKHTEAVDALVDTGATFSMIPATMLRRMGIEPDATLAFRIATGEIMEYATGGASLAAAGRRSNCRVIFGAEDYYTMGSTSLGKTLLAVDPMDQCLVPGEGSLSRCHGHI